MRKTCRSTDCMLGLKQLTKYWLVRNSKTTSTFFGQANLFNNDNARRIKIAADAITVQTWRHCQLWEVFRPDVGLTHIFYNLGHRIVGELFDSAIG